MINAEENLPIHINFHTKIFHSANIRYRNYNTNYYCFVTDLLSTCTRLMENFYLHRVQFELRLCKHSTSIHISVEIKSISRSHTLLSCQRIRRVFTFQIVVWTFLRTFIASPPMFEFLCHNVMFWQYIIPIRLIKMEKLLEACIKSALCIKIVYSFAWYSFTSGENLKYSSCLYYFHRIYCLH